MICTVRTWRTEIGWSAALFLPGGNRPWVVRSGRNENEARVRLSDYCATSPLLARAIQEVEHVRYSVG